MHVPQNRWVQRVNFGPSPTTSKQILQTNSSAMSASWEPSLTNWHRCTLTSAGCAPSPLTLSPASCMPSPTSLCGWTEDSASRPAPHTAPSAGAAWLRSKSARRRSSCSMCVRVRESFSLQELLALTSVIRLRMCVRCSCSTARSSLIWWWSRSASEAVFAPSASSRHLERRFTSPSTAHNAEPRSCGAPRCAGLDTDGAAAAFLGLAAPGISRASVGVRCTPKSAGRARLATTARGECAKGEGGAAEARLRTVCA
mmetsp:Transcript_81582/g.228825  ORF Transcript_81582/g.228825 Transcript_81582/m.228825 type:complete len:256 (+) Transcript_81582:1120-1887(+)